MARKKTAPSDSPPDAETADRDAASGTDPGSQRGAGLDEMDLEEIESLLDANLDKLQVAAAEAFDRLSESATHLAAQAQQVYETGQEYVRHHPGLPLLGALAFGVAVGVLLGRK